MFNVRLAGGHLYGKQLFTWLSLVVSLMASFVLSFFRGTLVGIRGNIAIRRNPTLHSFMGQNMKICLHELIACLEGAIAKTMCRVRYAISRADRHIL